MNRAIEGTVSHCELVFVNDFTPTALCITNRIWDKFPKFIKRKLLPKTKGYRIVFYEFHTASVEQIIQAWNFSEKIVADEEYQMCSKTSVASHLPMNFSVFFKQLYSSVLGDSIFITPDEGKKPIYCVTLTGLVVNKVFPHLPRIDETMNPTDLLVLLTRQGLLKRVEGNPPNYNPFTKTIFGSTVSVEEGNEDSSDLESDSDMIDIDAVYRDLEIGISKDSQFVRSTQSLYALQ
jgi:hypothetical protein